MPFEVMFKKTNNDVDKEGTYKDLCYILGEENVSNKEIDIFAYSKDYSPITTRWTLDGKLATLPDFIVWPETVQQIANLLSYLNEKVIPVLPFGSGSGVVGGALPIFGGILIDMKKMDKIIDINTENLTATIQTGKNGMNIERELNTAGYTLGHIPQSVYTSTLGGYLAHKAAGQFSTKYGKIEDMVISLEAVLPTGEIIRTKAAPRNSVGPQLDKLLIGSEGTLAIITEATLRIWPKPKHQKLLSFSFKTIENALDAVKEILQNQIFPAVIRIYDRDETLRHFPDIKNAKNRNMIVFVCEGNNELVTLEAEMTNKYCLNNGGIDCGEEPVHHWIETRFKVKETSTMTPLGFVVDTLEVSSMWDKASTLYHDAIKEMKKVPGVIIASGHASHFYPQGVCFYFSFGGTPINQTDEDFNKAVWDACMRATIRNNGSISHHHGIGINRTKWMKEEWGSSYETLKKIKQSLDPKNIMNPGKLYEL
ncbi:MAG: FAD-binding oxidoreductase [Candidatus Heimdallarchaeota archaeon]|nr:FAD-binding oxidoreductase [Candidatus Heimdallarchaeota archaeon]